MVEGACVLAANGPALSEELTLSSVQLSLSLFSSVVATFSLLHFTLQKFAHWGPTHKTAAL